MDVKYGFPERGFGTVVGSKFQWSLGGFTSAFTELEISASTAIEIYVFIII